MQSLNEPDPKEELLASDARLALVAQNVLGDPIVYQGKAEVMSFFQGYEHADSAREFLSVDGGAFMIEVSHSMPHPRMGILIFEVNPDGKIQNIKVWTGDLRDDTADLNDTGLTGVASLAQRDGALQKGSVLVDFCQILSRQLGRSVCAGAAGTTEHRVPAIGEPAVAAADAQVQRLCREGQRAGYGRRGVRPGAEGRLLAHEGSRACRGVPQIPGPGGHRPAASAVEEGG